MEKPKNIPIDIIHLAAEALSDHNDGWAKKEARDKLIAIRDYINNALRGKR